MKFVICLKQNGIQRKVRACVYYLGHFPGLLICKVEALSVVSQNSLH